MQLTDHDCPLPHPSVPPQTQAWKQNAAASLSSAYSWKDLGWKRQIPWITGSKTSRDKVLRHLPLLETPLVRTAGVQQRSKARSRGLDKQPQAAFPYPCNLYEAAEPFNPLGTMGRVSTAYKLFPVKKYLKPGKTIANSKIQKENCKAENNKSLIKCLQNITLC